MKMMKVFKALSTETNIEILKLLNEPKSAMEVFKAVKSKTNVKNRETIYKDLENLREAGLLEKFYDTKKKKILYKLKGKGIKFEFSDSEIDFIK